MSSRARRGWFPLASVRARATAGALLVVGVASLSGSFVFLALLRDHLVMSIDEALEARAQDVVALAREGTLPRRLAVFGGEGEDDALIQVVDGNDRVMAASVNIPDGESSLFPDVAPSRRATTVQGLPIDPNPEKDFRLLALPAETPSGLVTVYVASELDLFDDTVAAVREMLQVGVPGLVILTGALAWVVVGGALRPVEAIRRQVAEISASALDRRVPAPANDDEIGRLARTMNDMLERLQTSVERQRRFVSDASHELRSPLASSRTQLEVGVAHPEVTVWESTAAELLAENQRMERLVEDLLFLARSDEGEAEAHVAPVDLDDVVVAEVGRVRARNRVRIDMSRVSAGRVRGHAERLGRVVRNLLENAELHARSVITVELGLHGGEVQLVVADDGPGIPRDERERIFGRFVRLDEARDRHGSGGAGLGLSIVREIVRAHDGRIWVEDTGGGPGTGARFVVRLPPS